ncbi:MAG TPA: aminoglycoside phosphotransferase family protein [Actinomycetes bacterium]|nr:aminoglycoside phosphotransferase family protein [Actinomycetes bacterium]
MSAPHGFDDDEATRRLLRSRPPRVALDWAAAALGGTVISVRPLRGGTASAVHLLRVALAGGVVERAVLRRYVRPELNAEEPVMAAWEARALRVVQGLQVPTPRLLAVDPTGARAGVPAVLMSQVAGRVDWSPANMDLWLERLATLLPPIHAVPVPPPGVIRPFTPYRQDSYEPPGWARQPAVWARAVEWFHRSVPAGPGVFIHRDFHPGNVLWRRGRVSGVVDWASASIGPASVDVGHCRGNLFGYGIQVAERFTAMWERRSGTRFDPWGDVVTIIGSLDGFRGEPPADPERSAVEDALARAVAELNGAP